MSKLEDFSKLKHIPVALLAHYGVADENGKIRFNNGDARARFRKKAETTKGNFLWANDKEPKRAYGYNCVEKMAQQSSMLLIVEGESDALTAWFHKRPALGIPGANMQKVIERGDVERFERVVVIREHDEHGEPDTGGKVFPGNVTERLRELGYKGAVFVADLPAKDLSALHVVHADDATQFARILDAAIDSAQLLEDCTPSDSEAEWSASLQAREREESGNGRRPSQTDILVGLINELGVELLRDAAMMEAYARVPLDGSVRALYRVRSRDMRLWLGAQYHKRVGKGARSQSMGDAISTIEARALHDPSSRSIRPALRIDHDEDAVYLDLGSDAWQEARITAEGWILQPHTRDFYRARGMAPLPLPRAGAKLSLIRRHIALDDGAWALMASCLVAAIATKGPYSLLAIIAEQGSGKSSVARMWRSLVDPSIAPLVGTPREDRDLSIAARSSYVLAIDNLSSISASLSDMLCRIATGAGHRARELYSDADEVIWMVCRPVVLTAITDVVQRGDLADRAVTIRLRAIPDGERRDETELWSAFEKDRPLILGALFDAVRLVLRRRAEVRRRLTYRPRMLDYAVAAVAAEEAYDVALGTWEAAHRSMRADTNAAVLESALAIGIVGLLDQNSGAWNGTASSLLDELTKIVSEGDRRRREWPTDATRLSGALRRLAPAFRAIGIEVETGERSTRRDRRRLIRIRRGSDIGRESASAASESPPYKGFHVDAGPDLASASASTRQTNRTSDVMRTLDCEDNVQQNNLDLIRDFYASGDTSDAADADSQATRASLDARPQNETGLVPNKCMFLIGEKGELCRRCGASWVDHYPPGGGA